MTAEGDKDIAGLKAIGRIVDEILSLLCAEVHAGVTTAELDAKAGQWLAERGALPTPKQVYDFPGNLCISVNDEVVHGIPSEREIRSGDLVKLDLTADKDGYVADATRMASVGPMDERVLKLARCAETALKKGLEQARAGKRLRDIGRAVETEVRSQGFAVIPPLQGHGVGRTVHELPNVPNYDDPAATQELHEGLIITLEPIISMGKPDIRQLSDGWTLKTRDGSYSAHYEQTIMVTKGAPLVLTAQ
ncbi:MAG: type I methionyl aminopeptidase [Desulfocurvibacter africanus]